MTTTQFQRILSIIPSPGGLVVSEHGIGSKLTTLPIVCLALIECWEVEAHVATNQANKVRPNEFSVNVHQVIQPCVVYEGMIVPSSTLPDVAGAEWK